MATNRKTKLVTPCESARIERGLTRAEIARRLRISERYVRQILNQGCKCELTARRMAILLDCPMEHFLHPRKTVEIEINANAKTV